MTELDPRTVRQIRGLVQDQHALRRAIARLARGQHAGRTTIHRGALEVEDPVTKQVVQRLGSDGVEHVGGVKPAQPAVPAVESNNSDVTIITDGDDVHGESAPEDWHRTKVHMSLHEDFEPGAANFKTAIWDVDGTTTVSVIAGSWYVRVVWETKSGLLSEPSDVVQVDVEPPVDAEEIEADLEDARQRIQDAREYADQQFETFDERVESAETDLNDAHDRIDAAEGALSTTQSDLDDAKADITAAQSKADQAVADALAAADLAEGKGQVISQISAPTGSRAREENLWVRLPDMKVHYYDSDKWKPVLDPDTIAAAQQAADALTKANDLQTKHDALKLAVDGEGGLKDRLSTAENTLEDKAASSDLQELDDILRGTEDLPPQIADRFYAAMAIVENLQAVSGWVGGVNLADGAVTAEKIEATREMITKIMGAEWAYIAEQLVVDGKIIANNADIISAVIKNLDVTEQSNFVDAFAEQLRTKEFTALVATMARAIIAAPNLWPDPEFSEGGEWGKNSYWITDGNGGLTAYGQYTEGGEQVFHSEIIPAETGNSYEFTVTTETVPGQTYLRITPFIHAVRADGTVIETYEMDAITTANDHTRTVEVTTTDPEMAGIQVGFSSPTLMTYSRRARLSNPRIQSMQDGRLLIDGTVDTRHLNVTEEMVASFARILHLVVDQIDVNSLWADTTWQNAGHFGSEDSYQITRVDGGGVIISIKDESGEFIPRIQLGGGDLALNFYDPLTGDPVGSLTADGQASGKQANYQNYQLAGRDLIGDPEQYPGQHPIIDTLPKPLACFGEIDMSNVTVARNNYGFLEISAPVTAGRIYKIQTNNWQMTNGKFYAAELRHTLGNGSSTPTVQSPLLHSWSVGESSANTRTNDGVYYWQPAESGTARILLCIRTSGTAAAGINFSGNANIQIALEDLGTTKPYLSQPRHSGTGGPNPDDLDQQAAPRDYLTGWTETWVRAYNGDGTRYTGTSPHILHGGGDGGYRTLTGGYQNTTGFGGASSEQGRTIPQATAGATIQEGTLTLTGIANPTNQTGTARVYLNTTNSAPTTSPGLPDESLFITEVNIRAGAQTVIDLPQWVLDRIQTGTFAGFTYHPAGNHPNYVTIGRTAPLRLAYQR